MKRNFSVMLIFSIILSLFSGISVFAEGLSLVNGHYEIKTADDFMLIKDLSAEYWIVNDIDLGEISPLGSAANPFTGKLLGRLNYKNQKATITADIKGSGNQALIAFLNGGTIKNIIFKGTVTADEKRSAAGIVACAKSGEMNNCENYADINIKYSGNSLSYSGGIVGYTEMPAALKIINCVNNGVITHKSKYNSYSGGIIGYFNGRSSANSLIDCANKGDIVSEGICGGVAGYVSIPNSVSLCANFGEISSKKYASGIVGELYDGVVEKSFNKGNIAGNTSAGIAAILKSNSKVLNCYNNGNITADETAASVAINNTGTVSYCYNSGTVDGKNIYDVSLSGNYNYSLNNDLRNNYTEYISQEGGFSLESFKGFSDEIWDVDDENEYGYPQIIGNLYGSIPPRAATLIDNYLSFEGEEGIVNDGFKKRIGIVDMENASGGKAITFLGSSADIIANASSVSESMISYDFNIDEEKKYIIWVRTNVLHSGEDSLFCSMDGEAFEQKSLQAQTDGFLWQRLGTYNLSKGKHSLGLFPRELNLEIDRIIISGKNSYSPEGFGDKPDLDNMISSERYYNIPTVRPPKGVHPRVLITEEDIPTILKNATSDENIKNWNECLRLANLENDGVLPDTTAATNYDAVTLGAIQSRAFLYALTGDKKMGESAISSVKNFCNSYVYPPLAENRYNEVGFTAFTIAVVYDWCFSLLSEQDKTELTELAVYMLSLTEVGYPPIYQNSFNGHGSESQMLRDSVAVAIAMADERPDIYDNVAGRIFEQYVPDRKFLFQAHMSLYSDVYSGYRGWGDILCAAMFDKIGCKDIFGNDFRYMPYWLMYSERPDGYNLRYGDSIQNNFGNSYTYQINRNYRYFFLVGNFFNDGYLKGLAVKNNVGLEPIVFATHALTPIEFLIFNKPELKSSSTSSLPKAKLFPSPAGKIISRTGWNVGKESTDMMVELNLKEYQLDSHDHYDAGSFQIYYKGYLAVDSGYYQSVRTGNPLANEGNSMFWSLHHYNYHRRTVAHNCMLVYNPNEPVSEYISGVVPEGYVNDGGQRYPVRYSRTMKDNFDSGDVKRGSILGYEFGDDVNDPEYTYMKGDLTDFYTKSVEDYERTFMFLNFNDIDYPGALIVLDRVVSSDPSYKKTWLLHGLNEPEINGNRTIFKNDTKGFNGKLVNDTIIPYENDTDIKKIKGFVTNDTEYFASGAVGGVNEGGEWRIDVSPKQLSKENYFLNVLQASDADSEKEPLNAELIETKTHLGVVIKDRVVVLNRSKEKTKDKVEFSFEGMGNYKITVADLASGTWSVVRNGNKICDVPVSEEGTVASFTGEPGSYALEFVSSENPKLQPKQSNKEQKFEVTIRLNNDYIYTDAEPDNISGNIMVSATNTFNSVYGKATYNDNSVTINGFNNEIKLYEGSNIAYVNGVEHKLNVAPYKKDGHLMVPLRFVAENLHCIVSYDIISKVVTLNQKAGKPIDGYATIVDCKWENHLGGNTGYQSYDNNESTSWATYAVNTEPCEIIYTFDKVYSLSQMDIMFNNPKDRSFYYEAYSSEDGINWSTLVKNGESVRMEVQDYQEIKFSDKNNIKYIKLVCSGNSGSGANNIVEIRFPVK